MKLRSISLKIFIYTFLISFIFLAISISFNTVYYLSIVDTNIDEKNMLELSLIKKTIETRLHQTENDVAYFTALIEKNFDQYPTVTMNEFEDYYQDLFGTYLSGESSASASIYVYFSPQIDGDVHDVWTRRLNNNRIQREEEIPLSRYENNENMTWFYGPQETGNAGWVAPYTNRFNEYVTSYVQPLYHQDAFIGIMGMYLDLAPIQSFISSFHNYDHDTIWITDDQEEVIIYPGYEKGTALNSILTVTEDRDKGFYGYNQNNQSLQLRVYRLKLDNGWCIGYSIPEQEILKSRRQFIFRSIMVYLLALLIIFLLLRSVLKRYNGIFKTILSNLKKVKNEPSALKIPIETNDEIGLMVEAINDSYKSLHDVLQENHRLAYHDRLTNLPNRNQLLLDIEQIMTRLDEKKLQEITICIVNLDDFRSINDVLGIQKGNAFIQMIAKKIQQFQQQKMHMYHTSIDEFVFLLPINIKKMEAVEFARQILNDFGTTIPFERHEFYITVGIGMATINAMDWKSGEMLRSADLALYQAKQKGRNQFIFYDQTHYVNVVRRTALDNDLFQAIKHNQFILHYQPKVDLKTNSVLSVEGLVRWIHPQKGTIYPNDFIPHAEQNGHIHHLGNLVLANACEQLKKWENTALQHVRIAINISRLQLINEHFVEETIAIIRHWDVDPSKIELEVTESAFVDSASSTIGKLHALKKLGLTIALDDFGTGYSSLNMLYELPLDVLKIDKSIIRSALSIQDVQVMIESIINLAHRLNLSVVSEGVESTEQLAYMQQVECDTIQGYYYSRPLPPDQLEAYLAENFQAL